MAAHGRRASERGCLKCIRELPCKFQARSAAVRDRASCPRRDVLVHPEQVLRVPLRFELREALEVGAVCGLDALAGLFLGAAPPGRQQVEDLPEAPGLDPASVTSFSPPTPTAGATLSRRSAPHSGRTPRWGSVCPLRSVRRAGPAGSQPFRCPSLLGADPASLSCRLGQGECIRRSP